MNYSPPDHTLVAVLRFAQLQKILQMSRSAIYERLNEKSPRADISFPRPFRYAGSRSVYWLDSEVKAWLANQLSASRPDMPPELARNILMRR